MSTRREILELLSAGQIDVNEATALLEAARSTASSDQPGNIAGDPATAATTPDRVEETGATSRRREQGRWLHIHVNDLASGRNRVRVNVPLSWVKFGMSLGASFSDELRGDIWDDVMDAIQDPDISGTLVEVEDIDDNEHVRIFVD
ncbi:MAG: DUF2089 domain-containing protein [Chloroflexi bacterium]|nr:DUF2089 domain-containing protein [Chloroflexota bacterium]